jgi:glycosyltransferase involved in cell wall biosynthesis
MPDKLKIAIIADPEIPVPPLLYGGIERIINDLIIELQQLGHSVSLFAHPDSKTNATRFYPYGSAKQNVAGIITNTFKTSTLLFNKPDVVHSFGRLAYLSALLPSGIAKVMSYQREPTIGQIKKAVMLSAKNSLMFTGCSNYITNQILPFVNAATVYNAVSLSNYAFCGEVKTTAPLIFLGRIEYIKGVHHAIYVAQQTGRQLIIAGNVPAQAQPYFDQYIAPLIDGAQINYIGPVNDAQKNKLLGNSAALLMPIEWNEPFGIVMAEALACGTPVIALKGGATTEVVIDGVNGFICNDTEQMIAAINNIETINRAVCRADAEKRFSSKVMTQHYLSVYSQLLKK